MVALALSAVVHAGVLAPLAVLHWASPSADPEPVPVIEVTLDLPPAAAPARIAPPAMPSRPADVFHAPAAPRPVAPRRAAPSRTVTAPAAEGEETAGSAAAAALPSPAPPSPAPSPVVGPSRDQLLSGYAVRLLAHIERHKTYPATAMRRGEEGGVTLHLTLARDGAVVDVQVVGQGSQRLAAAALDAIARAAPFPPLPDDLAGERVAFTVPILYRLR